MFHVEHVCWCRRAMFHVKRPCRKPSSRSTHRAPLFHVKRWAGRSGSGPREPGRRRPRPAAIEQRCLGLRPVLGLTPVPWPRRVPRRTAGPRGPGRRAMASRGRCGRNGAVRRRERRGVESLPAIPARTCLSVGRGPPALPPSSSSSVPHPLLAPEPPPAFCRPCTVPATGQPAGDTATHRAGPTGTAGAGTARPMARDRSAGPPLPVARVPASSRSLVPDGTPPVPLLVPGATLWWAGQDTPVVSTSGCRNRRTIRSAGFGPRDAHHPDRPGEHR